MEKGTVTPKPPLPPDHELDAAAAVLHRETRDMTNEDAWQMLTQFMAAASIPPHSHDPIRQRVWQLRIQQKKSARKGAGEALDGVEGPGGSHTPS